MEKIYFEEFENLKNVYQWKDVSNNIKKIIQHFLDYNEDVLYIMDKDSIKGIVSIGDLIRYCQGIKSNFLNHRFSYLEAINIEDAKSIFRKIPSIHEIPVIQENRFIGVVKNGGKRDLKEWKKHCDKLNIYINIEERTKFLINEILYWKKNVKDIDLLLYHNVNSVYDFVTNSDIVKLNKKLNDKNYNRYIDGNERGFCFDFEYIEYLNKNGVFIAKDYHSRNLNIINGHRLTPNANSSKRKIFIFGPCTAFGAYVNDYQTIEFYLQEKLNRENIAYEVVNCGILGPEKITNTLFFEEMVSGDKVIMLLTDYLSEIFEKEFFNEYKGDLSNVYSLIESPVDNFFDVPPHCNGLVNSKIADLIWEDLKKVTFYNTELETERKRIQSYYISYDVHKYFAEYIEKYNLTLFENKNIGAIVMNCNPFTLGHRYLIEKASSEVDYLYIFVVEEDKSYFRFKDRFEMVKEGTSDLSNIKVVPSGKYVISKETFSQYFEKDNVELVEDMDYDIRIFGEVIAKKLNISVRFVGEEPTDIVTKKYNDTMKRILPEYGIKVIEYSRKQSSSGGEIISASSVRRYLETGEIKKIEKLVPDSTMRILMNINKGK